MTSLWNAIRGGASSLIAPPHCRVCRRTLFNHTNAFLCAECVEKIPWIGEKACRVCGHPAGASEPADARGCRHCRDMTLRLTAATAVARYRGGARSLVLSLKFASETGIIQPMAALMAERLARSPHIPPADFVVPVPLHPARKRLRGFDQAELLSREVAERAARRWDGDLLRKAINTTPQSSLRRNARLRNMHNAFVAAPAMSGKTILLVDDVMTTGATLADCARACREAGAKYIGALVFAR